MSEIAAVKIPTYNSSDPQLWFKMCESTFALATPKAITNPTTKFNYVVAHLPPDTASLVRDIILQDITDESYRLLQDAIINRCGESRSQEIRKLLAGEQLGDRKPSQLLRDMQRRAQSHDISDALLLELFINQMPSHVQSIIASIQPITPQKAADVADRILEVSTPEVNELSNPAVTGNSELLAEVRALRQEVAYLRRSRDRSTSRASHQFRRKSVSTTRGNSDNSVCWYHAKFQEKALKCKKPCSYSGNSERQE